MRAVRFGPASELGTRKRDAKGREWGIISPILKEDLMASGLSLPRWGSNTWAYCKKTGAVGFTNVCKASKRTREAMGRDGGDKGG